MCWMYCMLMSVCYSQISNQGKIHISVNTNVVFKNDFVNTTHSLLSNDGSLLLKGNVLNSGTFSYTKVKQGNVHFIGSSVQNIENYGKARFCNVFFNNSNNSEAFYLLGDIEIDHQASFIDGVLDTETLQGGLHFTENATAIVTQIDESHVKGNVFKSGRNSFEFPVGNYHYLRTATIGASDDTTAIFSSSYVYEDHSDKFIQNTVDKNIEVINTTEFWRIEKVKGSAQVYISLKWNEETTLTKIWEENLEDIHIVRWNEKEKKWLDVGGVVDRQHKRVTTITPMEAYGIFTLAKSQASIKNPTDLKIYNGISPNGDGKNDFFKIEGLQNTNNQLSVFNRWGNLVYRTKAYGTQGNVFRGEANKGTQGLLPAGTYFYMLSIEHDGKQQKLQGYLYIHED